MEEILVMHETLKGSNLTKNCAPLTEENQFLHNQTQGGEERHNICRPLQFKKCGEHEYRRRHYMHCMQSLGHHLPLYAQCGLLRTNVYTATHRN